MGTDERSLEGRGAVTRRKIRLGALRPEGKCPDNGRKEEICLDTLRLEGKCPGTRCMEGIYRGRRRPDATYLDTRRPEEICADTLRVTLGLFRNRSAVGIKGNQATFDNSQRNNLRSCVWVRWWCG